MASPVECVGAVMALLSVVSMTSLSLDTTRRTKALAKELENTWEDAEKAWTGVAAMMERHGQEGTAKRKLMEIALDGSRTSTDASRHCQDVRQGRTTKLLLPIAPCGNDVGRSSPTEDAALELMTCKSFGESLVEDTPSDQTRIKKEKWCFGGGNMGRSAGVGSWSDLRTEVATHVFRIGTAIVTPQLLLSTATYAAEHPVPSWSPVHARIPSASSLKGSSERSSAILDDVLQPLLVSIASLVKSTFAETSKARLKICDPLIFAVAISTTSLLLAIHWQLNKHSTTQRWIMWMALTAWLACTIVLDISIESTVFCVLPRSIFLALVLGEVHQFVRRKPWERRALVGRGSRLR